MTMQIADVLDDLKKRSKALTVLKKEITDDKDKKAILEALNKLIDKMEPVVTERKRLIKLKTDIDKFAKSVDSNNADQRGLINGINSLKADCKSIKTDTKTKDFSGIAEDAVAYVRKHDGQIGRRLRADERSGADIDDLDAPVAWVVTCGPVAMARGLPGFPPAPRFDVPSRNSDGGAGRGGQACSAGPVRDSMDET